ncbi:MAG: TetR/AcrR family transcriptional regulator [Spirochaetaceae bacterium]|jgi:AcrR family transcriptional regulator|nr:TetR/AcrR family transcriptional regulator [Spirochaetaceae bacterium]
MPPDPANTIEKILKSAGAEFLRNGYAGASLRKIAAAAGLTTGALYRHYADKESLYRALVEPVYREIIGSLRKETDRYEDLLVSEGLNAMWEDSGRTVETLFRYVYEHLDAVRLLVSASKQTVCGDFKERLIQTDADMTARYIRTARRRGYNVQKLSKGELNIIIRGQYAGFFEIILQNDKLNEVLKYVRTYSTFCNGGWKKLLEGQ